MKTHPVRSLGLMAIMLALATTMGVKAQMQSSMTGSAPVQYAPIPSGGGPIMMGGGMAPDPLAGGYGYGGDGCDAYGCGDPYGGMMGGGMGGGLPGAPFGGYDSMQAGQKHGPFGDGGCCAPRWFDFHAEWMYLQREKIASQDRTFTSDGIQGPALLGTDNLSFSETSGFRITGAYLIAPSTSAELTYFGTHNWDSSGVATNDQNNLYSVVSDFGVLPAGGFAETDQAFLHRLAYSSELHNGELNFRRRWVSANCLFHSSFLGGVRYLRIGEDLEYFTQSNNGQLDYDVRAVNDMVGFQLGFDSMVCLTPRFKFGAEVEAGVYGNHAEQNTVRTATSLNAPLRESLDDTKAAFVGEAGLMGLFRLTPRVTIRGGYTIIYVNGVALATDNFNPASVFTPRVATLDTSGDALYHGANLGMEFTF